MLDRRERTTTPYSKGRTPSRGLPGWAASTSPWACTVTTARNRRSSLQALGAATSAPTPDMKLIRATTDVLSQQRSPDSAL